MRFSTHNNLHYFISLLKPKAFTYHVPNRIYGLFKIIMCDHTKCALFSYVHVQVVDLYLNLWQKQRINKNGLKQNFLLDMD